MGQITSTSAKPNTNIKAQYLFPHPLGRIREGRQQTGQDFFPANAKKHKQKSTEREVPKREEIQKYILQLMKDGHL